MYCSSHLGSFEKGFRRISFMEERKEISLQPYTFFPDEEGENSKSNVITTTDGNLVVSNYFCWSWLLKLVLVATVSAIKNARVKKIIAILCRFMGQLYIDKFKQFLF